MNIVYKFTSKVTGKFYIGSKSECVVINNSIVCRKNGTNYYSSSSDETFWEELNQGNMSLEILEEVPNRGMLLEREAYHQIKVDAVNNPMCFNKRIATDLRNVVTSQQWGTVVNRFNETLIDKTKRNSAIARLNTAAIKEGHLDYGNKVKKYLEYYDSIGTLAGVDKLLGRKGYAKRLLKGKSLRDFDSKTDLALIQNLLVDGASFIKSCMICDYQPHVVVYQHGFTKATTIDVNDRIAISNGFYDRTSFREAILAEYLKGSTVKDIADSFDSVSSSSVSRMVQEEVIKRLGGNVTK